MRNALIATHDALATALAVLASFYLRFEGELWLDRLPLLLRILPYFIVFSVVVCYVFNLTTTKWRFISLARCVEYFACGHRDWPSRCWCWIIFLSRPTLQGAFFFGKVTIILFWFLEVFFLSGSRFAYRYFRYTRVRHHARIGGRGADAAGRPCCGRRNPVARN